ncbi:GNAT family N-acetyltransferase, partial [Listeria booriae]|nr:GNAT family N-acetyltransferase [Listeria booriae]
MTQLIFRNGTEQDTKLILRFITELATYEGIEKDVVATESGLH